MNNNSGIYLIESKKTGRQYVGLSSRLSERKKNHFGMLRRNQHPNRLMQRHVNKYGLDDLVFTVIEYCDETLLPIREIHHIEKAGCLAPKGFNLAQGGGGRNTIGPMSDDQKANISKAKTRLYLSRFGLISIKQAARIAKVEPITIYARLYRGLTIDQAIG
jgi:group I intron endonuclease